MGLEKVDLMKKMHIPVKATSFPSVTNTLGFFFLVKCEFVPIPGGPKYSTESNKETIKTH